MHLCRRLILFLDGTWNEDEEDTASTNIVYLRERLFWGIATRLRTNSPEDQAEWAKLPEAYQHKAMASIVFDGFEYLVFYDRGVGTGALLDPIKGGLTGAGLDDNIRQAYKFLSFWYRPGDEIFVFGFSRGAFTARSLCGYLHAVGLLTCENCTPENEERAWRFYRTTPRDRLSGDWLYFRRPGPTGQPLTHYEPHLRIRAACVFDTVGALGIPAEGFRRLNRQKYEFHDTEVNSLVDIRLHAVAIDEPRRAFEPSMWTKPKFKKIKETATPTEQVWFPGAHADIGGGYVKWNQNETGLSHLPLVWMMQRLNYHIARTKPLAPAPEVTPDIPTNYSAPLPFFEHDLFDKDYRVTAKIKDIVRADQHKPWAIASTVRADSRRVINQIALAKSADYQASGRVPHADPIGEMIHISAFERLNQVTKVDKGWLMSKVSATEIAYQPPNLIAVIPYIAATYLKDPDRHQEIGTAWKNIVAPIFSWLEIKLVDWDGFPLDPTTAQGVARAFQILPEPGAIGCSAMPGAMQYVLRERYRISAATGHVSSEDAPPTP